ncbi:MAG: heat-inducible transcriptional repressor HrcA [Candidatus Sericytochromatia bacterium]|nr:heat-inducible transcriptional repressor HrcA [Candidatus Sericytochromatia bacterium]
MLNQRQRDILRAVVDDYVSTAEPVGSRTLSRKYGLGLSPATIRNALADLEDEGLLRQPHTSAGRVPSDQGYRVFVEELMSLPSLSPEVREDIRRRQRQADDLRDLMTQTARLAAVLSGCTAIVRSPRPAGARIRALTLVPVTDREALLVVVATSGSVTHRSVTFDEPVHAEDLADLALGLQQQLVDRPLDALTGQVLEGLAARMGRHSDLIRQVLGRLEPAEDALVIAHTAHLARQPEFQQRIDGLLDFLDRPDRVLRWMHELSDLGPANAAVRIRIGSEHRVPELQECSVVAASYTMGGEIAGEVAILGPTRLDYGSAVTAVSALAAGLTEVLGVRLHGEGRS